MTEQEYQAALAALVKKESNLLLFEKNEQQIFVLGTIHQFHFDATHDYSLSHLQNVIKAINPDVLLIEADHGLLKEQGTVRGPFEMIFARCLADELHIPIKGIDHQKIVATSEEMNTLQNERDDRMFENILDAAKCHGRALALIGASHRGRMPARFEKSGYSKIELDDALDYFGKIDIDFVYPKSMIDEYLRRSNHYQTDFLDEINRALNSSDELYKMFVDLAASFKIQDSIIDKITHNRLYD
ncbi:MAG: hypothetical protein FWE34_00615 [Defluviitaleaceae bacterium]|nr:hypothetical protein [Defluviitaleaceae bacterium]